MRKSFRCLAALLMLTVSSIAAIAQSITVTGSVKNGVSKEVVPAVSIIVKGSGSGTFTDEKGNFRLVTFQKLPFTLVFTSVGYDPQELAVSNADNFVQVDLVPSSSLGVEVVVSASRVPERILESPVSIERVSLANIRNTAATSYYDIFRNVKGVDITTSSLTFNTVCTRGFNGSGSARVNQLVDGMDNQAPGLNFAVGNVIGLTELDVENMELLPGASSALYGSGGMNGTILITSKDPFKYQGFSMQVKQGIMHVDKKQRDHAAPFYDWSMRWAHTLGRKAAFKIGAEFIQAKDWLANDTSDYQVGDVTKNEYGGVKPGTRFSDPNYDGVNVYGDETFTNIKPIIPLVAGAIRPSLPPPLQGLLDAQVAALTANPATALNVSRTGYYEKQVVDNTTLNFKASGAFHYKFTDNLEALVMGYLGTGNTVYTGSDRYALKNLKMAQYKFELKHKYWFLRAYTTQENAGDTYNATITTRLFNEKWKASTAWYPQYIAGFLQAKLGLLPGQTPGTPADDLLAHNLARAVADIGRPEAGSAQFKTLFDQVRSTPIKNGGGLFLDRTDLYAAEGQLNLSPFTKVFDLVIGANWKQYVLNSQGTLFADTAGNIKINEVGGYGQVSKSIFGDRLKLTAAGRYDKNDNFDGRFTPRFTAVIKVKEDHNIRLSYQTAYRFPTTQNQWINLVVGGGTILIGGLPQLKEIYGFSTNPPFTLASVQAAGAILAGGGSPSDALAALKVAQFGKYKPESMRSFEAGYKGLINKKLLIDVYGYYGKYEDFLGRTLVVQATTPASILGPTRVISVAINSPDKVTTYGYGASVDWMLPNNFNVSANVTSDHLENVPAGFVSFFNVPGYRVNVGVGNTGFGWQKRFGFNAMMRTQNGFFYENDFRQGELDAFTIVDAQVSFKLPQNRSIIKIGGTNILNKYYKTAFANPEIGGLYYVSFAFNAF